MSQPTPTRQRESSSTARDPRVILCGPYPTPEFYGGIARWDELLASSTLQERFGIQRQPITLPDGGSLLRRLLTDIRRTRDCLTDCDAPIFQLTAQYMRGTYREYAQYRLARRAHRRFVLDIRGGCFVECYEDWRAPLRRKLLREMLRGADAITVEGRSYVDWIRREIGREATWIPNFVQAHHASVYPRAHLERPGRGQPIRLVYAGRLIEGKGLEPLLAALRLLRQRGRDIHLSVLGGGEADFQSKLDSQVAALGLGEAVEFVGPLPHAELLERLSAQHLFVFPTEWWGEGHPNSVNEAMQVGLPIVTTRHGFLADVVTPECGTTLDSAAPEVVADAVDSLVGNWDRLRDCGQAAHDRVYREFSDEVALGRMAQTWDALIAKEAS